MGKECRIEHLYGAPTLLGKAFIIIFKHSGKVIKLNTAES